MLTAQQARQISQTKPQIDVSKFMSRIQRNIEAAINEIEPRFSCNPLEYLGAISDAELKEISSQLTKLGYTITKNGAGIIASW